MMEQPDDFLTVSGALSGIDAMRIKSHALIDTAERLAIEIRHQQTCIDSVVSALAPYAAIPDSAITHLIPVIVSTSDFQSTEILIARMFDQDPDLGRDAAIHEIFMAGLTSMAHRLIPTDDQEHF